MTEPFDVQALYQAADLPLPPDPAQAQRLWASLAADLAAAADEIRAGWARVERLEEALREIGDLAATWRTWDQQWDDDDEHAKRAKARANMVWKACIAAVASAGGSAGETADIEERTA